MKFSRYIVYSDDDVDHAVERLMQSTLMASDVETYPMQKKTRKFPFVMTINCYSGLIGDSVESYCFRFQTSKSRTATAPANIEKIYRAQVHLNASGIPFTGHNYVYDLMWYLRYGMPIANWSYDSMIMFWSKWPELPKTLDFVSSILDDNYQYWKAGRKSDNFDEYCDYGMSDTQSTLINTMKLIEMAIADPRMRRNFFSAFSRCVACLSMSAKGVRVNAKTLEKYDETLTKIADEKLERLRYLVADPEFNPNSPKQKSKLIYGMLGARFRSDRGRFVKTIDDASTGAVPLRAMRNDHPIFRRVANGILEAIEPAKQLSNVVGMVQFPIRSGGERFLTAYDGVGTTTTRLSSRGSAFGHGGNGQNVRKDYRAFLEADPDSFLLDVDFSGCDEVFVSFESKDPKKIEVIRSGKDIHALNALIFFANWTYDAIIKGKKAGDPKIVHPITGIRQITKKLVHGNNYLMAGLTLLMTAGREAIVAAAIELGFSDAGFWPQDKLVKFCEVLERKFREHYVRLKRTGPDSWYGDIRAELVKTGGFTTAFNYFQRFLGDPSSDDVLRAAAATAGQANTAGRINSVMDELLFGFRILDFRDSPAPDRYDPPRMVSEETHGIGLRLQTHDSLTFNCRYSHPNWRAGVEDIFYVMRRPVVIKGEEFVVGIEAEASYRWAGKEGQVVNSIAEIERFLRLRYEDLGRFDELSPQKKAAKVENIFDSCVAEIYNG